MSTAPARTPDAFDRFGAELAEMVNPIVVKEIRQGLRTRVFWVFFTLMLVSCLFIALTAFASNDGVGQSAGKPTFIAVFVCLAAVQFFVIPYTAYRSMVREAEDETWVLLTLTGLGPRSILAGKLGSFVLQGLLYASAAAPFLLFSYFLNGIDLPTIALGLLLAAGYSVFLVSVSVSLATLAESRLIRSLLHFVVLGVLFNAFGFGIGGAFGLEELAQKFGGSTEFWLITSAVLFVLLSTGALLFEAAASRLSLATENYARGPRLAYLAQFLGGVLFFILNFWASGDPELFSVASVVASAYAVFVGIFVVSDRDGSATVHWEKGRPLSLLKPGALRGFAFVVGLLLLALLVFVALTFDSKSMGGREQRVLLAAPAYALILLTAPILLSRVITHPPSQTPALIRILFIGVLVILVGFPPLVGEAFATADDPVINCLNPLLGLINIGKNSWDESVVLMIFAWTVALLLTVITTISLRARDKQWL